MGHIRSSPPGGVDHVMVLQCSGGWLRSHPRNPPPNEGPRGRAQDLGAFPLVGIHKSAEGHGARLGGPGAVDWEGRKENTEGIGGGGPPGWMGPEQ